MRAWTWTWKALVASGCLLAWGAGCPLPSRNDGPYTCSADAMCAEGWRCVEGTCARACGADADCPPGTPMCLSGACRGDVSPASSTSHAASHGGASSGGAMSSSGGVASSLAGASSSEGPGSSGASSGPGTSSSMATGPLTARVVLPGGAARVRSTESTLDVVMGGVLLAPTLSSVDSELDTGVLPMSLLP